MKHSNIIGGSTAKRVINCPGSVALSERAPPQKPSPYAIVGSALHAVMEGLLSGALDISQPDKIIGATFQGVTITNSLFDDKILPAWEATQEIFDNYGVVEYAEETKVRFTDNPDIFGTTDLVAVSDTGRILLIDYKFGDGVIVDPEDNEQLLFYAAAAAETPTLSDLFTIDAPLTLGIIQPTSREDMIYKLHDYNSIDMLKPFKKRVFNAVREAEQDAAPLASGEWCRFCPAAPLCPLKTGAARAAAMIKPEDADSLSEALQLAEDLEPWIKQVRALAHEQLEQGQKIAGWKLVDKRATRRWTDEDEVLQRVRNMRSLKLGEATTVKLLSPPQLEKVLKRKGIAVSTFKDYIESCSSGTTLAPASDKRPESTRGLAASLDALKNALP